MRLKSFYARTVTEAMKMVRETLGEDAVIVATREEKGGKTVRVTAAVERPDTYDENHRAFDATQRTRDNETQSDTDRSNAERSEMSDNPMNFEPNYGEEWLDGEDGLNDEDAVIEHLTDVMLRHSVPEEITDQILSCATVIGMDDAEQALTASLEHLYAFKPLPERASNKAFMLVGPPGAGKTLMIAKLSARAVMNGEKVMAITCDTVRAGGIEQLQAFTKLMKVDLQRAKSPEQLKSLMENIDPSCHIYIDTAGMNPFKADEMKDLARLISAGNIEPVLVMPAGLDPEESGEIARIYGTLGVRYMIATRLDIARRLGGLLSAAHYGGLFFADSSNQARVAEGLMTLSPNSLTRLLMPEARRKNKGTKQSSRTDTTSSETTERTTVKAG